MRPISCHGSLRSRASRLPQVLHREGVRHLLAAKLLPGQRHGDRRARPRARRIGRDRGRLAAVAQIVDEDAVVARRLLDGRGVARRGCPLPCSRRCARQKSLASSHGAGRIGSTTCRPLPPVVLTKLSSFRSLQPLAHLARRGDHVVPCRRRGRDRDRTPGGWPPRDARWSSRAVDLQHAGLRQRDQAAADRRSRSTCRRRARARACSCLSSMPAEACFWKKHCPLDAVGAAHQRQHAAGDVRPHPVPDLLVIFRQHLLGDAGVLPIDPVGMGERHAGDRDRLRFLRAARPVLGLGLAPAASAAARPASA